MKEERPYSARLRYWRSWAVKNGADIERPKPGVLVLAHDGHRHVYKINKWAKDGKYAWCSSMPVDFLAKMAASFIEGNPDVVKSYMDRP